MTAGRQDCLLITQGGGPRCTLVIVPQHHQLHQSKTRAQKTRQIGKNFDNTYKVNSHRISHPQRKNRPSTQREMEQKEHLKASNRSVILHHGKHPINHSSTPQRCTQSFTSTKHNPSNQSCATSVTTSNAPTAYGCPPYQS